MRDMLDDTPIGPALKDIEAMLQEAIKAGHPELSRMSGHIIFSGGKRIRPALGLAVYRALDGRDMDEVVPVTVALELIHTATLIHDDIIDGSPLRRGAPSVHKMFGEGKALVAGDFLFARAFGMCARYGSEVIDIASQACVRLAEGELLQMETPLEEMTARRYFDIISRKTAVLFSAGARVAAMNAKASEDWIDAMADFGHDVGLAFQMVDDLLDLMGDDDMGKPKGTDIKEGKPTLATVRARDRLSSKDSEALVAIYNKKRRTKADVRKVLCLVTSTDAVEFVTKRAEKVLARALDRVEPLGDSEEASVLRKLSAFVVERRL